LISLLNDSMIKADKSNKTKIAEILTRSFNDNQSANWVIGAGKKRIKKLTGLMNYAYSLCVINDGVYLSKDNQGAIIFDYPNRSTYTFKRFLEDINFILQVIGLGRLVCVLRRENYIKKYHPKTDYIYLWFLGVNPEKQGKGTGEKLLQDLLDIADKEELPVYLETSTPRNLNFYKKFGFYIYHEWNASFIGFTVWFMKRNC